MTVWTVLNAAPCPACSRPTDLRCEADRHRCAECGADRGPCDKQVRHIQQLALF